MWERFNARRLFAAINQSCSGNQHADTGRSVLRITAGLYRNVDNTGDNMAVTH